jgi:hypothetical protein
VVARLAFSCGYSCVNPSWQRMRTRDDLNYSTPYLPGFSATCTSRA